MQTLLLLGLGYVVLSSSSGSRSAPPPPPSSAPPPQGRSTGADLAAAFGAFVGSLINEAQKDE